MALVTLAVAKKHLRITDDTNNADVETKVEQASAIVLDYLKIRRTAIASVSVASPTVVTTSTPHSLTDGATSLIADTSTTPSINGSQVITVTGPTTFTVPVAVTVGQTSAAGSVASPNWTDANVPKPVQFAVLSALEDLYERRPINWEAIAGLVIRFRDPAYA